MWVSDGKINMGIPFYRVVDFGLVYPLLILPLGFVFSANMVNLLAGYNGLETGMGLVYTGMLSIYAYVNGSYVASLIALVTFSALLAFFIYNKYPAKIFPGDSLTYLLGGAIAIIGITGDIERAAIIAGIPFIIEFFLKMRSKFKAQTYGHYENGKVKTDYDKIYSLPHIFTRTGKFTEKQVVYIMMFIELIFCSVIWFI